eukprot:EG_transcript_49724
MVQKPASYASRKICLSAGLSVTMWALPMWWEKWRRQLASGLTSSTTPEAGLALALDIVFDSPTRGCHSLQNSNPKSHMHQVPIPCHIGIQSGRYRQRPTANETRLANSDTDNILW